MSFKVGSFNVRDFNFESNADTKKNFDNLAKIIEEEEYDIVALQEVLSEQAIRKLIDFHLGGHWKGKWDFPEKSSVQAAEGYAFLWNTRRIMLANNEEGKEFEPRILNQYKIRKKDGQTELIRNPYYGRFCPKNLPKLEIRLINVHIRFSKNKEFSITEKDQRRNEFAVLTEAIYPKYEDKIYGCNNASYTFILGDYNLNIVKPTIIDGRDHTSWLDDVVFSEGKKIITVQEMLSTLKSPEKKSDPESDKFEVTRTNAKTEKLLNDYEDLTGKVGDYFANNYDHFTYNAEIEERLYVKNERVDAVKKYYNKDSESYQREISDHVPIKIIIEPNTYNALVIGGEGDVY